MNCLKQRKKFKSSEPAWVDPSDPDAIVEAGKPCKIEDEDTGQNDDSSDDDDDDMYANDVRSKKLTLDQPELRYKHLVNINQEKSFNGAVMHTRFNPKSRMALVSLTSSTIDLYEVDGERNRYLQKIRVPRTKDAYCEFKPDGDSIVITSAKFGHEFYTHDLKAGKTQSYRLQKSSNIEEISDFVISENTMACRTEDSADVNVLSSKTFESLFTLTLNEPVRAIQFTSKGEIVVAGTNANVYIWDIRNHSKCKHKFQDEGSTHITSMSLTSSSDLISIGSDSGVVNTYEYSKCRKNKFPTPLYTFTNLKTSVDILRFNYTGELMLMGSTETPGGFRLIHSHTGTVYKNFPAPNKKYGAIKDGDFSPLSGYLAMGSTNGRAYLCRLPYFSSY